MEKSIEGIKDLRTYPFCGVTNTVKVHYQAFTALFPISNKIHKSLSKVRSIFAKKAYNCHNFFLFFSKFRTYPFLNNHFVFEFFTPI